MKAVPASSLAEFAAALIGERELAPRARILAHQVEELLPESGIAIYSFEGQDPPVWKPRAAAGEIEVEYDEVPTEGGTLGSVAEQRESVVFKVADIAREDYAHLNIKRSFASITYFPIQTEETLLGVIEVVSYGAPLDDEQAGAVSELTGVAALAFATAISYEKERNDNLQSIARLTELYDLELVFSATLDLNELMPIITSKIQLLANVQAVNLWLVGQGDSLLLADRSGFDLTYEMGTELGAGQGIPSAVADSGNPVLIASPEDDERLKARNGELAEGEGAIFTVMAVPLVQGGKVVGVLEAVNKMDGTPFDDDDLFLLTTVSEAAATSLHNASLITAERKLEIMETLVTVSQEITSTLNLERVLQTIVDAPQAVIPYERAAIALEQHGRYRLSAVTGMTNVNADSPELRPFNELVQWAALSGEVVDVRQHAEEIEGLREETRAKFEKYFSDTGMRGFYALPLNDDTGRVGILCMESSDPDFLSAAHLEIIKVLAGQATVALRNAQMYKEVPFIALLEPVLEQKRKFMALEKRRRATTYLLTLALAVFLVVVPLPMRVDGDAVVAPVHRAQIQPEVEGVVQKVFVREGQHVQKGQVLAQMQDWDYRSALAGSDAKYQSALLLMNRALATNDGTEAGIQRVQADYWKAEVARNQQLLDSTRLRSPIDGVMATPQVENMAGRRLQFGDNFAEVIDTSKAVVDVAVDDEQAGLMQEGSRATVKLNFYPTHPFRGIVTIVSPKGEMKGDTRVFYARVLIENPDGIVRSGMEGRGKVLVGWRPAGYVIFRGTALWIYSKLWTWFGW